MILLICYTLFFLFRANEIGNIQGTIIILILYTLQIAKI
jgi:hypothetical protein